MEEGRSLNENIVEAKFRIQTIDLLPDYKKHKSSLLDMNNEPIYFGQAVIYRGGRYLVNYRYGETVLKAPFDILHIKPAPNIPIMVKNEVVSAPGDFVMIGFQSEPLYEQVKHLEHEVKEPTEKYWHLPDSQS